MKKRPENKYVNEKTMQLVTETESMKKEMAKDKLTIKQLDEKLKLKSKQQVI